MIELHKSIVNCKGCALCNNQPPLIQNSKAADVFWVGLSAVKTSIENESPLSSATNSGKLIDTIENLLLKNTFHKTNLVKCLPLDVSAKIRYPSSKEMKSCFFNLKKELSFYHPKIIFLLGKQVSTFVLQEHGVKGFTLNDKFEYSTFKIGNIIFVPVHHPSYILVYKRKYIQDYILGIQKLITVVIFKDISKNGNIRRRTKLRTNQLMVSSIKKGQSSMSELTYKVDYNHHLVKI